MKIGILTLPLHTNYGGILQAYALQTVLERMGHEVIVFDQDRDICRSVFRQMLTLGKYIVNKFLLRKNVRYFAPREQNKERREREQHTRAFIEKYINVYLVRHLEKDVPKNLDAIVVGSDQVWRHLYFTGMFHTKIENAFLNFTENRVIKRVAYAASFGTDDWEYSEKETQKCAQLLGEFDAVSVREKSAVALCKEKLGRADVQHLLDPTMLLTKEDYIQLVKEANTPPSEGNLMCYILDESQEKKALINRIADERNLVPFYANSPVDDAIAMQSERIQPPLEQWLRGFMDAEFVVTDSFHACVFSIIFGKPFVAVGNKERGMARFESLLSLFILEKNLIDNTDKYDSTFAYSVNAKAQTILDEMRKTSFSFLSKSLK